MISFVSIDWWLLVWSLLTGIFYVAPIVGSVFGLIWLRDRNHHRQQHEYWYNEWLNVVRTDPARSQKAWNRGYELGIKRGTREGRHQAWMEDVRNAQYSTGSGVAEMLARFTPEQRSAGMERLLKVVNEGGEDGERDVSTG